MIIEKGLSRKKKIDAIIKLKRRWPRATCWPVLEERPLSIGIKNCRINKKIDAPRDLKRK